MSMSRTGTASNTTTTSSSSSSSSGVPHYTARRVVPLGLGHTEDGRHVTEYLCFVRNECIEIFAATVRDVQSSESSAARGVVPGQVGMRCRFCAHRPRPERANRSTSFPSSTSRIYQSLTMMMREHLPACTDMPPAMRERYQALRAGNTGSRTKESKRYWIASARTRGLIDTDGGGMRMQMQMQMAGGLPQLPAPPVSAQPQPQPQHGQ